MSQRRKRARKRRKELRAKPPTGGAHGGNNKIEPRKPFPVGAFEAPNLRVHKPGPYDAKHAELCSRLENLLKTGMRRAFSMIFGEKTWASRAFGWLTSVLRRFRNKLQGYTLEGLLHAIDNAHVDRTITILQDDPDIVRFSDAPLLRVISSGHLAGTEESKPRQHVRERVITAYPQKKLAGAMADLASRDELSPCSGPWLAQLHTDADRVVLAALDAGATRAMDVICRTMDLSALNLARPLVSRFEYAIGRGDATATHKLLSFASDAGISADAFLWAVVEHKDVDTARQLLSRGASANCRMRSGAVLHVAIRNVDPDMVELLLRCGADPNAWQAPEAPPFGDGFLSGWQPGLPALHVAAALREQARHGVGGASSQAAARIVELLLSAGADAETRVIPWLALPVTRSEWTQDKDWTPAGAWTQVGDPSCLTLEQYKASRLIFLPAPGSDCRDDTFNMDAEEYARLPAELSRDSDGGIHKGRFFYRYYQAAIDKWIEDYQKKKAAEAEEARRYKEYQEFDRQRSLARLMQASSQKPPRRGGDGYGRSMAGNHPSQR